MIQQQFAERAKQILATNQQVIGLAVAGSWLTNEMDEFSDLDLVLVTDSIEEAIDHLKIKSIEQFGLKYAKPKPAAWLFEKRFFKL